MKIRKNKSLNVGHSIDLTKERLRNFANEYANNYSLIYTDIIDEEGTERNEVSLKIPIL